MSATNSATKKIINVPVDVDAHMAARHHSLDTGLTMGEIVSEALRAYLTKPKAVAPAVAPAPARSTVVVRRPAWMSDPSLLPKKPPTSVQEV